ARDLGHATARRIPVQPHPADHQTLRRRKPSGWTGARDRGRDQIAGRDRQAQGVLQEREQRMITSIFAISEKPVHEVMVPRTDIVAIDVDTPPDEILKIITHVGHSRIPLYEGSPDNIIGILYVKDLFRRLARGEKDVQIRPYMRPAQFVPESKKIDQLLRDMQKDKIHIAIVVDEYGGTSGLVTI